MGEARTGRRKWLIAGIGVTLVLSVVTALARTTGRPEGDAAQVKMTRSEPSAAAGGGSTAGDTTAAVPADLPAGIGDPKVVKTVSLDLEVKKGRFSSAFDEVATIAAGAGGFVSSSTSSAVGSDGRRLVEGTVVLRVPADRFDDVRRRLLGLGKLTREELHGDDVGGQLADLDARLRNLHSQEDAIRLLMDRTKSVAETITVQQQLGMVREQIEQLTAQQTRLDGSVALSTITVGLTEPGAAPAPHEPSKLTASVRSAVRGAESVAAATIVVVGYLLPLALLAGLGWLLSRPFARRRAVVSP